MGIMTTFKKTYPRKSRVPRAMEVCLIIERYMHLSSATIVFLSCFYTPPCLACRLQEGLSGLLLSPRDKSKGYATTAM